MPTAGATAVNSDAYDDGAFEDGEAGLEPVADREFEQFWAAHGRQAEQRKTILGVEVVVPTDLPLRFEEQARALEGSHNIEDVKALLRMLFGADVLDGWVAHGVTGRMFRFLLMWGTVNGQGQPHTFEQAWPLFEQAEAEEAAGKAPVPMNRAQRRAAARASCRTTGSATSGPSSRPTSPASTASTTPRWPTSADAAS